MLHEDLESANKAELLETKYNLLKLQNKCHSNQITQLNRELERSRSERRGLTAEMERLEAKYREEVMVLNFTISNLQEEVEVGDLVQLIWFGDMFVDVSVSIEI